MRTFASGKRNVRHTNGTDANGTDANGKLVRAIIGWPGRELNDASLEKCFEGKREEGKK